MAEETPASEGGVCVGDTESNTPNGAGKDASSVVPVTGLTSEPATHANTTTEPTHQSAENQTTTDLKTQQTHKPLPLPPVPPQPQSPRPVDVTDNKPPAHNTLKHSSEMDGGTPKLDRKGSVACIDPITGNHADDKKKVSLVLLYARLLQVLTRHPQ